MNAVWSLDIGPTDKLVLLALADNANDDGECWPSMRALIAKSSLSERGVQTALTRLQEAGYVERDFGGGRGHTTRYIVRSNPAPRAPSIKPRTTCTQTPHHVHPNPAPRAPETPQQVHPEPPIEPSRTINEPPSEVQPGLSVESWQAFKDHRREIKQPLTKRAEELALRKLALFHVRGIDVDECINQSILSGWSGLFEPKESRKGTRPKSRTAAFMEQIHACTEVIDGDAERVD